MKIKSLLNQQIGRLVITEYLGFEKGKYNYHHYWLCKCICGATKKIAHSHLTKKAPTLSCGCLTKESIIKRSTKHGLKNNRIYAVWTNMLSRCLNKDDRYYPNYGGRGIEVCETWKDDLIQFYKDMGDVPIGMSIERIDVNQGYYKENCKWASNFEQSRNKTNNRIITAAGKSQILADWAKELECSPCAIIARIKNGWSELDAVTVPKARRFIERNI